MSPKKKVIEQPVEVKSEPAPKVEDKSAQIIRDLVALVRVQLPGREFVVLSKAERYLKEQELDVT
jgi:hypothetical protein